MEAWVTLATNDTYALGCLVLGSSLKRAGTNRKLHCMITTGVSDGIRRHLSGLFDELSVVNVMDSGDEENLALIGRPDLGVTFTKLHCWRLTQYSKCVFLDADILVVQNADDLFDHEEFSAAPDIGWPDIFNSGVFVFTPSLETYRALLQTAVTHGSFDGGDQGLLNSHFSDWRTKSADFRLSFVYNMSSSAIYTYAAAYKKFAKDVKIVHYLGAVKPWHHSWGPGGLQYRGESQHLVNHVLAWWNVFIDEVHPRIEAQYSGMPSFVGGPELSTAGPVNPSGNSAAKEGTDGKRAARPGRTRTRNSACGGGIVQSSYQETPRVLCVQPTSGRGVGGGEAPRGKETDRRKEADAVPSSSSESNEGSIERHFGGGEGGGDSEDLEFDEEEEEEEEEVEEPESASSVFGNFSHIPTVNLCGGWIRSGIHELVPGSKPPCTSSSSNYKQAALQSTCPSVSVYSTVGGSRFSVGCNRVEGGTGGGLMAQAERKKLETTLSVSNSTSTTLELQMEDQSSCENIVSATCNGSDGNESKNQSQIAGGEEAAQFFTTPMTDAEHRRDVEAGNVDYMGRDSWENIQKRLDQSLGK